MDRSPDEISIRRQCELLGVNRAGLYYQPLSESEENLRLMRLLDEQYTRTPFYGSRRMVAWLETQGIEVNRKRVSRLMELMDESKKGKKKQNNNNEFNATKRSNKTRKEDQNQKNQ